VDKIPVAEALFSTNYYDQLFFKKRFSITDYLSTDYLWAHLQFYGNFRFFEFNQIRKKNQPAEVMNCSYLMKMVGIQATEGGVVDLV